MMNHKLVLPNHLNHYGYLFGGNLLQWADEFAWVATTLDYPDCNFVTIGMDKVRFLKSVTEGTILEILVEKMNEGNTTVGYQVSVYRSNSRDDSDLIFTSEVTFIRIDEDGNKMPLPGK